MLQLHAMTQEEFARYLAQAVDDYATGTARAWKIPVDVVQPTAQKTYDDLLPQGVESPGQFLYTARSDGIDIGMAWIAITEKSSGTSAYIYDIMVREAWRGRGFGRQLLAAVEQKAAEQGAKRISLNVFGFNTPARTLYETAGFEVGGIGMFKQLA